MAGVTLEELAALGEELLAGMARMRETVDAMGRSLSLLERTTAELRQDVTRLGERVKGVEVQLEKIAERIEASELLTPDYLRRSTCTGQRSRTESFF